KPVTIMSQQVSRPHHPAMIGIAPQNPQAPLRIGWTRDAREDAITAQEEIPTECGGQETGPQTLGLHKGDREEREVAISVKRQTGWQKRFDYSVREGVRQHQRVSEE